MLVAHAQLVERLPGLDLHPHRDGDRRRRLAETELPWRTVAIEDLVGGVSDRPSFPARSSRGTT